MNNTKIKDFIQAHKPEIVCAGIMLSATVIAIAISKTVEVRELRNGSRVLAQMLLDTGLTADEIMERVPETIIKMNA